MKNIILFLGLVPFVSSASLDKNLNSLKHQKKEMEALISSAKTCVPDFSSVELRFCSGIVIHKQDWAEIKAMNMESCVHKIESKGYKVFFINDGVEKFKDFLASSRRAETLHEEKKVVFRKNDSNRIDCLHELLHVFQQDPKNQNELSTGKRAKRTDQYIETLTALANDIEVLEKSHKTSEAKKLAQSLNPYLEFAKKWQELDDWFLENEVHFFILKRCEELNCITLDKEIATANLMRKIEFLPLKERAAVSKVARELLKVKTLKAYSEVKKEWRKLDAPEKIVESLLSKTWDELIAFLKNEQVSVFKIKNGFKLDALKSHSIPKPLFDSLPDMTAELINESKILNAQALAKFMCLKNGNAILLSESSTMGTIIHEYLHHRQSLLNKSYCSALNGAFQLNHDFETGKISRTQFEDRALWSNGITSIAEYEVYKTMVMFKGKLHKIEHLNNEELLKKYESSFLP